MANFRFLSELNDLINGLIGRSSETTPPPPPLLSLKQPSSMADFRRSEDSDTLPPIGPSVLPDSYTVQPGDSLWNITKTINGDATSWPKLYQENKQVIGDNPNLILPKQKLNLTPILPIEPPLGSQRKTLSLSSPSGPSMADFRKAEDITPLPILQTPTKPTGFLSNVENVLSDFGKGFWQGGIRSAAEGYKADGENTLYALQQETAAREKRLGLTPTETGKSFLNPTASSSDIGNQLANLQAQTPYQSDKLSGKIGSFAGSVVGNAPEFALGGVAMEPAAEKALSVLAPKVAPKLLPYAERAVRDSLSFAPIGLIESNRLQDIPGNIATNALTGAVLGPALHGVGEGLKLGVDVAKNGGSLKQALAERTLSYPEINPTPLDAGTTTKLKTFLNDPNTSDIQRIQIENILKSNPKLNIQDVQGSYQAPSLRDVRAQQLNQTFMEPQSLIPPEPRIPFAPTKLQELRLSPLKQNIENTVGIKNPLSPLERSQRQDDLSSTFKNLPNRNSYSFTTGEQRALAELQDGIQVAQNYIGHTDVLAPYPPGTTVEQAYADIKANTGVDLPQLVGNWEKAQAAKTSLTSKELELGRAAGVIPSLKPREPKPFNPIPLEAPTERILPEPLPLQTWTNKEIAPESGGPLPLRSITEESLGRLPSLSPPLKAPTGKLGPSPIASNPILQTPIKPIEPRVESSDINPPLTIPKSSNGQILSPETVPNQLKPIPVTEPVGTRRLSFPDTIARGEITNPELATRLGQTELNYGNITNKDTLEAARKFIETNRDDALHLVMSDTAPTAESNAVAQLLIKEANDSGKFDQAISIIEKTASKAKTQGQAIQALSMWGRLSPEGILKFASNTIEKSKTIKQVSTLDNATRDLTDAIGRVNTQAAGAVSKEVESGVVPKLSNKPSSQINSVPKLSEDIIKKLDGFEAAARARIAESKGRLNSLPVDVLADYAVIGTVKIAKGAVKFSAWSADMIKEFGDEIRPHLAKIWDQSQKGFDDFAKVNGVKGLEVGVSQVDRSVSQGLKDMNQNIGDIVRQHYSVGNKVQTNLVTQLIEKAGLSGEDAAALEKYVTNRMKELTQAKKEQILNQMFKPRLAPKQKDISQKIIELSNLGGFQNEKYKTLIGEKLGIPTLDEATAKSVYEQSNKIQTMPDGREKDVAIAQMLDSIAAKVPPTMLQKIGTLQTMAQLLNAKTAIRNVVGNLGFAGMENASNTLGAGIDKGLSLFTKQRTRTLPSLSTQLKGGREGLKLGFKDAVKGINTTSNKTQFDLNTSRTFRSGVLGKLETAMNIELRAPDRAFYQAAYDDSLRQQMKLAKVTEPTEAMKEIADYDGLYKTFQDTNAISSFFSGFKKLLNDPVHWAGKANNREPMAFGLGDFVLKYPKTPGNLLARGIDYSPAGFVKVVMEASKPLMGKEFNQRAFVDALSRSIVGTTGLVGTGALLHRTGIITGKPDSDYDVAALNRQVGLGEYKINASALKRFVLNGFNPASAKLQKGDTLIDYSWFQPQALPLAMGADIDKNGAKAQGIVGTVLNGLATGVNTFADQPVMQGISSMFGQRDFSDGITKIMQGVPASFVPTFLNQVKQLLDNQKRNTYSPNWIEKTTNLAASKIPLLETKLQPTYDALGNKAETYQNGSNNPLNVFLNPAFVSQYSPSKEAELALNAYQQTGETKQIPTIMPKYFTVTGERFDLTPEEYSTIQRIVGETTQKGFSKISPSLKTDQQIDQMTKAIEKARLEGKKAILDGRGVRYVQSGNTLKLKK